MLTYGELRAGGMSRRSVARDVDHGSLRLIRRGVYQRIGTCDSVRDAASHGGSLACVSAAEHHGIWVTEHDARLHVGMSARGRCHPHEGCRCVVHWSDSGTPPDAFGVPSVKVVLRQILRCRGLEAFFVSLESALRRSLLTEADVGWLRAHTNAAARDAIAFARRDADSGLESLLRWRLRPHGLPVRTQQTIISVGRVDFVIGARLIVEVDGAANHDGESHRHRDLVRDAHAAIWGFVTLRFDYAMVMHDWPTVERAILAHVDRGIHLA